MNSLEQGYATPQYDSIAEILAWVPLNEEVLDELTSVAPSALPPLQSDSYVISGTNYTFQVYIEPDLYLNTFKGWVFKVSSASVVQETTLMSGMSGDITLDISPETAAPAPTSAAWTRDVVLTLKDTAGNTHTWYSGTQSTKASIADTSTAGTASIASQDVVFVNGVCTIEVSGDAQDWLDTETDTLTIADLTIMGYTITGGTSVETFTAP